MPESLHSFRSLDKPKAEKTLKSKWGSRVTGGALCFGFISILHEIDPAGRVVAAAVGILGIIVCHYFWVKIIGFSLIGAISAVYWNVRHDTRFKGDTYFGAPFQHGVAENDRPYDSFPYFRVLNGTALLMDLVIGIIVGVFVAVACNFLLNRIKGVKKES